MNIKFYKFFISFIRQKPFSNIYNISRAQVLFGDARVKKTIMEEDLKSFKNEQNSVCCIFATLGSAGRSVENSYVSFLQQWAFTDHQTYNEICDLICLKLKTITKNESLGTGKTDRFPGINFPTDKEMKELGRGSVIEKSHGNEQSGEEVRSMKWMDNHVVFLVTSFDSAYPLTTAKRYDRKQSKEIEVACPKAVVTYNKFMGGVDPLDGLVTYYRIDLGSRKYYMRIFYHFLDMALVNSWLIYRRASFKNAFPTKLTLDLDSDQKSFLHHAVKKNKNKPKKEEGLELIRRKLFFKKRRKKDQPNPLQTATLEETALVIGPLLQRTDSDPVKATVRA